MKKALTIKNVDVENIEYLNSLQEENETAADAFSKLVVIAKEFSEAKDAFKIKLVEQENRIKELVTHRQIEFQKNSDLENQIAELKNAEPQIKEVIKEITKEVVTPLNDLQFICTLTPENERNARLCRKYLAQEGVITESNRDAILSQIANKSISFFLAKGYPHILNR